MYIYYVFKSEGVVDVYATYDEAKKEFRNIAVNNACCIMRSKCDGSEFDVIEKYGVTTMYYYGLAKTHEPGFGIESKRLVRLALASGGKTKIIHGCAVGMPSEPCAGGSQGHIYRSYYNGKVVAAKIYLPGNRAEEERRMEREVLYTCSLSHPNVIEGYGIAEVTNGSEGKAVCLVMKWMNKGSLRSYISTQHWTSSTLLQRAKLLLGAARGLSYLHYNNIMHRDISSNNIFVSDEITDLRAVIGDLGLAREFTYAQKSMGIGSVGSQAPEIREGGGYDGYYDESVDVYSFGKILAEASVGHNGINDITIACTQENKENRPTMEAVTGMLSDICRQLAGGHIA